MHTWALPDPSCAQIATHWQRRLSVSHTKGLVFQSDAFDSFICLVLQVSCENIAWLQKCPSFIIAGGGTGLFTRTWRVKPSEITWFLHPCSNNCTLLPFPLKAVFFSGTQWGYMEPIICWPESMNPNKKLFLLGDAPPLNSQVGRTFQKSKHLRNSLSLLGMTPSYICKKMGQEPTLGYLHGGRSPLTSSFFLVKKPTSLVGMQ